MNQSIYPRKSATAGENALGKGSTTFARLMCPSEVADATKSYPKDVQARVAGRWMLCGDISSAMFSLLKKAPILHFPTRVTGFKTPAGHGYGVLTHQVHGCGYGLQSRFILCLSDRYRGHRRKRFAGSFEEAVEIAIVARLVNRFGR